MCLPLGKRDIIIIGNAFFIMKKSRFPRFFNLFWTPRLFCPQFINPISCLCDTAGEYSNGNTHLFGTRAIRNLISPYLWKCLIPYELSAMHPAHTHTFYLHCHFFHRNWTYQQVCHQQMRHFVVGWYHQYLMVSQYGWYLHQVCQLYLYSYSSSWRHTSQSKYSETRLMRHLKGPGKYLGCSEMSVVPKKFATSDIF